MRIIYIPLEAYGSRYTLQLREWTEREFKRLHVDYLVIGGHSLNTSEKINTGVVLDAHNRCFWAMSQIQTLVSMLKDGLIGEYDFILFEDMFHPGIESLAYVLDQQFTKDRRPKIGMRCLAQTLDPDDFVYYTGMAKWMRPYEQMVNNFVDIIFMNSEEMLPFATVAGWTVPCVVTGNAFGKQEVIERLGEPIIPFHNRPKRIAFTSRLDDEKQPEIFIALAKHFKATYWPEAEFAVLSGGLIKSRAVEKAVIDGYITVYPNLSKQEYYSYLNRTRLVFNCSLQDWVSITLLEADALGCNILAPAYRSFPEALDSSLTRTYIPWSFNDMFAKMWSALNTRQTESGSLSDYQDKSIDRTIQAITLLMEDGIDGNVQDTDYRKNIVKRVLKGIK